MSAEVEKDKTTPLYQLTLLLYRRVWMPGNLNSQQWWDHLEGVAAAVLATKIEEQRG